MLAAAVAMTTIIGRTAVAQGPGHMMDERGWGEWRGAPWRYGPDAMIRRIDGRLAFIKAELKIDEKQTTAWNALADAVRNAAKHHNERMKGLFEERATTRTLPERLDAQEQLLNARLDKIRQIKSSLKNLYDVLSDEQKEEADDIVLPMVGMGGMGIGMGGWHWMR